ncbi:WecB/TagA/CpsF family glycosyltransferase [Mucilaginibacter robiniae]|nr:WecB/TagA/CpsF family glycosyltransferase [Mucilaginibacter robiniae]
MAEKDETFKAALMESDVLLPDGVGITVASSFLNRQNIKKIAGADFHHYMLEKMNEQSGSCFYLGSSENTLSKIRERIKEEYPNIRVETYSPPYKPEFTEQDSNDMIAAVNNFQPDVLFIGMTAPKQEKWIHAHKALLNTKVIGSIGAVFDFYAGTIERPPSIWIRFGLEWLGRLVAEPKRMWKRYLYYGPAFVMLLVKNKTKQTFKSNP